MLRSELSDDVKKSIVFSIMASMRLDQKTAEYVFFNASEKVVLDHWLRWHGIIGYTDSIYAVATSRPGETEV